MLDTASDCWRKNCLCCAFMCRQMSDISNVSAQECAIAAFYQMSSHTRTYGSTRHAFSRIIHLFPALLCLLKLENIMRDIT